jgi:hypothetical protein
MPPTTWVSVIARTTAAEGAPGTLGEFKNSREVNNGRDDSNSRDAGNSMNASSSRDARNSSDAANSAIFAEIHVKTAKTGKNR